MPVQADDVFTKLMTPEQIADSERRGQELLARYLTLKQLRKARDLTQVELARVLGKEQVAISQLESRADMLLSTLRGYVEAMGGTLDLVVRFKDGEPVFLAGIGDEDANVGHRDVGGRRTSAPAT
jgi:hypothetical protein